MKQRQIPSHYSWPCLILLALVVVAGCTAPTSMPSTATAVVLVISPTIAASSTIPPSPTSTATRTPTATWTRIPRWTATPQPTNTPTPTVYPTLDSQGRLNFVLNALETNQGCTLPCWWGITPGKTKWNDMIGKLAQWKIGYDTDTSQLLLNVDDGQGYSTRTIDVTIQKKDDLVEGIDIQTDHYDLMANRQYAEAWSSYSLDQVLNQSGIPTQVYLDLTVGAVDWSPGPGMQATFDLWVEYADKGFAVRYPGELIGDNQGWYVCPTSNNTYGITIKLRASGSQNPIVTLDADNPFQIRGTLKKLTGMNTQQFYEMFKQKPPQGCLLARDLSSYSKITLPKPSMILPAAKEEEYLINNLANNDDCELPCWWGIKPGETTTQYVQQMFLNLGKSVSHYEDDRGVQYQASLFGRHSPYPFDYTVYHRWFDRNGIVDLFGVTGSALDWSPPQHFAQDWNRYALHEALTRYGVPSKVLVHYWNFGWRYDITLVYEDKGFLIRYSGSIGDGKMDYDKPLNICPTQNKPTEITIWVTRPGSGALKRFRYGRGDLSPSEEPMLALEEVTNMSLEDFYEIYRNPDVATCFRVPNSKGEMAP